jgi:hypothetical protein
MGRDLGNEIHWVAQTGQAFQHRKAQACRGLPISTAGAQQEWVRIAAAVAAETEGVAAGHRGWRQMVCKGRVVVTCKGMGGVCKGGAVAADKAGGAAGPGMVWAVEGVGQVW